MKRRDAVARCAALIIASAGTAYGAGGNEAAGGILTWLFIGFCALILVGQTIPALLMILGWAKGLKGTTEEKEAADKTA